MLTSILCLAAGMLLGAAFSLFKLPLPAPTNIEGIIGIVGVFVGYKIVEMF